MDWISESLKERVRLIFEKKYGKKLTESELLEIADNLTSFVEALAPTEHGRPTIHTRRN